MSPEQIGIIAGTMYLEGAKYAKERVELLEAKLDKACEALEFYAEPDEWDTNKISTIDVEDTNIDGVSTNTPWGYTILKGGKRAREALQEIRKNDD